MITYIILELTLLPLSLSQSYYTHIWIPDKDEERDKPAHSVFSKVVGNQKSKYFVLIFSMFWYSSDPTNAKLQLVSIEEGDLVTKCALIVQH